MLSSNRNKPAVHDFLINCCAYWDKLENTYAIVIF